MFELLPYADFRVSGTRYVSCAWWNAAMENLNSFVICSMIVSHVSSGCLRLTYSNQIIQVNRLVAVGLHLQRVSYGHPYQADCIP